MFFFLTIFNLTVHSITVGIQEVKVGFFSIFSVLLGYFIYLFIFALLKLQCTVHVDV